MIGLPAFLRIDGIMARLRRNGVIDAAYGKVGDLVVKHYKYGMVLSRRPRMGIVPPSEKQLSAQAKWSAAAEYYRKVKANPALAACYAGLIKKTGYALSALTNRDFYRPPAVTKIDLSQYRGLPGNRIELAATDDFCVAGVMVTLKDPAGAVLEEGQAISKDGNMWSPWSYVAKTDVTAKAVVTIEAVAEDLPGNRGMLSATWRSPAVAPVVPAAPQNEPTSLAGNGSWLELRADGQSI